MGFLEVTFKTKKSMYKKIILASGLPGVSLCSSSQVSIGIRGGLSIPGIVAGGDNPLSKGYSSRLAEAGGLFAEWGMSPALSLRLGVEYSGQGGKRSGVQAMKTSSLTASLGADVPPQLAATLGSLPELLYADVKSTTEFHHLMVPLSLQAGRDFGKG